jgi:hypothetical protein
MRLTVKKQAIWLILAMIIASRIPLDYPGNPKFQQNINWSESVGSGSDGKVQNFNGPIYKTVYNVMNFLEKRNLDVRSQNGRFILFYKVK